VQAGFLANVFMSTYNLLKSPEDLFQKLLNDFDSFERDFASVYKALDCASSAWHLTDWVYYEYERINYPGGIGLMRNDFIDRCNALGTMHDVITNAKHVTVSKPQSNMTQGRISFEDIYPPHYTETYGNDWLMIEFNNGDVKTMYALIAETIKFWNLYFEEKRSATSDTTSTT
jgi:hypothetical protein